MQRTGTLCHFVAMISAVAYFMFLPILVSCSGEGNIRLLADEVAVALKACSNENGNNNAKENGGIRQRRSSDFNNNTPTDINSNPRQEINNEPNEIYNVTGLNEDNNITVPNSTNFDYKGSTAETFVDTALDSAKTQIVGNYDVKTNFTRNKRSEPLFDKPDTNQCLSQCVFANLQVVDSRGIPRETELWNLVQSSVTSQQSRAALRDQIRACFQELQSEAEDNGCSYSNKLERCLMLRFADRKTVGGTTEKKAEHT